MTGMICDCCNKMINVSNLTKESDIVYRVSINKYIGVELCSNKMEIRFDICTECLDKLMRDILNNEEAQKNDNNPLQD